MTSPRRLGCAALLATALLVPATALPASADSVTVTDRSGDVTALDFDKPNYDPTRVPEETKTDITRVDVDYRSRYLVVVVRLAEARANGKKLLPFVRVKGAGRDNTYTRGPGGTFDELRPTRPGAGCQGGSVKANPAKATYRFKIPAACLGTPDKVRVGAAAARYTSDSNTFYVDDARTARADQNSIFLPRLGTAISRGR